MKYQYLYLTLVVFLFSACSMLESTSQKSVFSFNYENQQFEIVSLNTATGEGKNILTMVSDTNEPLTAHDINQDGIIDVIIRGNSSLVDANQIYAAGINAARRSGNYQERQPRRVFEWDHELYSLEIITYMNTENDVRNLFTIRYHDTHTESIYMDYLGDGILDTVEKGEENLARAQQLYEVTLLKGVDEGRIRRNSRYYEVLKKKPINQFTSPGSLDVR